MKKNNQTDDVKEFSPLVIPANEENVRETTTEFPTVKEEESVPEKRAKKKNGLFHRERDTDEREPRLVFPISENEEVRVFGEENVAESQMDDTREVFSELPTQPIPELNNTVVIEEQEEEAVDEKASQMLLEGFEEEEPEDNNQEAMRRDERLRRVRREQIEDFSHRREMHMRETEAEELQTEESDERGDVVYPETPLEAEKEEEPVPEREKPSVVIGRLTKLLHRSSTTVFLSVLVEIVLFLLMLFSAFSPVLSLGPVAYLVLQAALFFVLCVANLPLLSDGFSRLFEGKPTPASGVAVSATFVLIHTLLQFLNTTDVTNGTTPLLTSIAGLGVLLLSISKRAELERAVRNASFVLSDTTKKTVYKCIENPSLAEEIGRPALALGEPRVAYYRESVLVDGYAKFSDDSDVCYKQMNWYLPLVLGLSLLISLIFFALNGISSWLITITLFCALVAVSAPALLPLSLQISLSGAARTAEKDGAVITGYQAAEQFGSVHALALDATDIFPEQCVLLHGIKTFSGTRIDDAILDAASVSVRAGGPLSFVFRRMIQNKIDMLRDVDTLVYEQDMGLSGWVSGRRVLIGNRKLLDNHGIDIPSKDYEQRYAINGRQLVYLSIAGELSAMFVVSYVADETVKKTLTDLTKQRVTLLVRTCDQNINERLISTVYDLDSFYVELLGAPAGRSFEGLVDGVSESQESSVISNGNRSGLVTALALCCRLRKGIRLFAFLQTALSIALLGFVAYTMFFAGGVLSVLYLADLLLGATLLFALIAFFHGKK